MAKKNVRNIAEKMALAPPGTDITNDMRTLAKGLSERERKLQEAFYRKYRKSSIGLSDRQIDKMRSQLSDYWSRYYSKKGYFFRRSDLPIIPALMLQSNEDSARKVIDTAIKSPGYSKEDHCIYHARSVHGELITGARFIALDDNLYLASAFHSINDNENVKQVLRTIRKKLVALEYLGASDKTKKELALRLLKNKGIKLDKDPSFGKTNVTLMLKQPTLDKNLEGLIEELENQGFNVDFDSYDEISRRLSEMQKPISYFPNGGRLIIEATNPDIVSSIFIYDYVPVMKCDGNFRYNDGSATRRLAKYLGAEAFIGDRKLAKKILENLGIEHTTEYIFGDEFEKTKIEYNVDDTETAARFLRLSRVLNLDESLPVIVDSKKLLDDTFIKKFGLYDFSRPLSFKKGKEKMVDLEACPTLEVALLRLYKGNTDETRRLLSSVVNAGLYKKGRFIDRDILEDEINPYTNALGIKVIEAIKNPNVLEIK